MFRMAFRGLVPLWLLILSGCATSSAPLDELRPQVEQALRPGDIVKVVVWREEDLTGEFLVDQSGQVILPRVGKWEVAGETESSLEERLNAALRDELRNNAADVIVLRRVQVLGAVKEPGLYRLDNTMRLGDALALAGGVDPTGRKDRIDIVREGERYVIHLDDDRGLVEAALRSGDSLYVPQRNWFVRNYGAVLTGLSSLTSLAALIISTSNSGS